MRKRPEDIEYSDDDKYGSGVGDFGKAKYFDDPLQPQQLSEKALYDHTLKLGWSHGCPVPRYCIETYGLDLDG